MGQLRGGSAWRIGRADDKYAGLAQLGERQSYKLDVTGSNPVSRTKYVSLAQMEEQLTLNQKVQGSNP